jgi:death on curing protein
MIQYLGLADLLLIGEAVLAVPAEVLALTTDLTLADSALNAPAAGFGGTEAYPDFATKAAVLCARLCKNHAFVDGNKRVAYEALREFVARNGFPWVNPPADNPAGDETVKIMWDLAANRISEMELAQWIADRIGASRDR